MSALESQQEELEVLKSIYDGDERFKIINETTFQCKIGEDSKSFLLEIHWPSTYPDDNPEINLDLFFNKHLSEDVKNSICQQLKAEVELNAGTAMTYTLFEWAKENCDGILINQPENFTQAADLTTDLEELEIASNIENKIGAVKKDKKVQLTKAQKRKQQDRLDARGERPRGWDWVDIVKHLSQSGSNSNNLSLKQVDDIS